ncbi:MAG: hypothetical protein ABGW50_02110 [Thermococcus sp.]
MPIVKTLRDRVEKYSAKFDANVIQNRLTQVESLAKARYTEAVATFTAIRELVRKILESAGVPAGQHAVYYSFAFKIASKAQKHELTTLTNTIEGLKAYWVAANGADPAILDKIANLVLAQVTTA